MLHDEFPNVLIVGAEPLGSPSGMGITLENVFGLWPKSRIAQIYTSGHASHEPGIPAFHFHEGYVVGAAALRLVADGRSRSQTRPDGLECDRKDSQDRASSRAGWKRAWMDQLPLRRPESLQRFLSEFKPDVIYTPLGFSRVLTLVQRSAAMTGAPVIPHFMDDWLPQLMPDKLAAIQRHLVRARVRRLLSDALCGFAISLEMAEEYSRKFDIPFVPLSNFVDVNEVRSIEFSSNAVGYVGGLHLNRWRPLLDVARAVERARGGIRLEIVAPDAQREVYANAFSGLGRTVFRDPVSHEQVPEVLSQYQALVHVEADDAASRQYVRLSLSTKIPQYLAAGRPLIAYGPQEVASMRHLRRSGAAFCISPGDIEHLDDAVQMLSEHDAGLLEMGRAGWMFAVQHHEREGQTEVLKRVLASAALRSE